MKLFLSTVAITALLSMQSSAIAADDYERADNVCGRIHADKSGDKKDAAIAHCIQEKYKENGVRGSQQVEQAKQKQCESGPTSSAKEKNKYMTDCSKVEASPQRQSEDNSDKSRERKKLGKGGLDMNGETHSGSSNKPASSTNTSGGVNTGNSDTPHKK